MALIREKLREVRLLYGTNKRVRTPKYVKTLTIATSADWRFPAKSDVVGRRHLGG